MEAGGDRHRLGRSSKLADVCTSGKDSLATGHHDSTWQIAHEIVDHVRKTAQQRLRERVDLRRIQGDDGDAIITAFKQHKG